MIFFDVRRITGFGASDRTSPAPAAHSGTRVFYHHESCQVKRFTVFSRHAGEKKLLDLYSYIHTFLVAFQRACHGDDEILEHILDEWCQ